MEPRKEQVSSSGLKSEEPKRPLMDAMIGLGLSSALDEVQAGRVHLRPLRPRVGSCSKYFRQLLAH